MAQGPGRGHAARSPPTHDLADAHTSMAYGTMLYEWDWAGAEASFRRAIAANPNYPTAHHWYADFLAGRGRLDEALEQMQEARRLDPLSLIVNAELAWVYYLMQRPVQAEGQIRQGLQLDPNFSHAWFIQGMILIQQHRPREAVASLEKAVQLGGFANHVSSALGAAYAAAGDSTAARRILGDFERRSVAGVRLVVQPRRDPYSAGRTPPGDRLAAPRDSDAGQPSDRELLRSPARSAPKRSPVPGGAGWDGTLRAIVTLSGAKGAMPSMAPFAPLRVTRRDLTPPATDTLPPAR